MTYDSDDDDVPPSEKLIRIAPFAYLHILNCNTNVSRLEVGPATFLLLDHERIISGTEKMLVIPPRHYCIIENPAIKLDKEDEVQAPSASTSIIRGRPNPRLNGGTSNAGKSFASAGVEMDEYGQAKLRHGEREIRENIGEPFPLFPGEKLVGPIQPYLIVPADMALVLRATRDFVDSVPSSSSSKSTIARAAGDKWMFFGPATYKPRIEEEIVEHRDAIIVLANQVIRLKASKNCVDFKGTQRKAGEEWLMSEPGAYIPRVDEEVVIVEHKIILGARQYVTVRNPVDSTGKPQIGKRKLVRGEAEFYLQPGEEVEPPGIAETVLGPSDGLFVSSLETHQDANGVLRKAGSRWLVTGPCEYLPSEQVEIVGKRHAKFQIESLNLYFFFPLHLVLVGLLILLASIYFGGRMYS